MAAKRLLAWATLELYCSPTSVTVGANSVMLEKTSCFCNTAQRSLPLLSTHTLAPGSMVLAYGKSMMSLAWATRWVWRVNARPVPSTIVRSPVKLNAMVTLVRLGTAITVYTPSTSGSNCLTISCWPGVNPCCWENNTKLVPSRLSQTCCIVPGTDSALNTSQSYWLVLATHTVDPAWIWSMFSAKLAMSVMSNTVMSASSRFT